MVVVVVIVVGVAAVAAAAAVAVAVAGAGAGAGAVAVAVAVVVVVVVEVSNMCRLITCGFHAQNQPSPALAFLGPSASSWPGEVQVGRGELL